MNAKPEHPVDPKKAIKHFWAMVVWNCQTENVEILEITQATIQASISALSKDEDWGSPFDYDIKVVKSGEGMETEYAVNPAPKKAVVKEAMESLVTKPVNLEALFTNGDPFAKPELTVVKDDLPF